MDNKNNNIGAYYERIYINNYNNNYNNSKVITYKYLILHKKVQYYRENGSFIDK